MNNPKLKIYKHYKKYNHYIVYLNKTFVELIKSDNIVFDKRNFTIRQSTIFDNKTYKITKSKDSHTFGLVSEKENIAGEYSIEQIDDLFYCDKI